MQNEANDIRRHISGIKMKITELKATDVGLQGMIEDLKSFLSGNESINPKTKDGKSHIVRN